VLVIVPLANTEEPILTDTKELPAKEILFKVELLIVTDTKDKLDKVL